MTTAYGPAYGPLLRPTAFAVAYGLGPWPRLHAVEIKVPSGLGNAAACRSLRPKGLFAPFKWSCCYSNNMHATAR